MNQIYDEMKIIHQHIDELKVHPDNPRVHSPKQVTQIAKSIETFGFQFPVLVDENNQIIAGHGRAMACKKLGIKTIPTLCAAGLSPEKVRALMIADNKLTQNATWDEELLAKNFKFLSEIELDFDIEVSGFGYGEIEQFTMSIAGVEDNHSEVDELDVVNDLSDSSFTITQLGDCWELGNHRLLCDDALDKDSYQRLLGRKKASMVITDPPYNLSAKDIGEIAEKTHGDFHEAAGEMNETEFTTFLDSLCQQLCQFSKSGSIHYIFMDWRHMKELLTAGGAHYEELKNLCIWSKDRAGMGSFYRSQHELVFVFKNGVSSHQNNFQLGQHGRHRSNIWEYPSIRSSNDNDVSGNDALALHPTMKPVRLISDAILDCSKRHELILDPFLGSGTTLLAAEQSKRICMGIEIDPRYVDITISRWQTLTGKKAIHSISKQSFDDLAQEKTDEQR